MRHIHVPCCCCPTIRCLHQPRPLSTPHERQSPTELISHPELKLCVFSAGAESRHWAVFVQPQHPVTSSDKPSHCWQMEDKHLSQESSDKQTHQKHSECSLCLFMAVHCCFFPSQKSALCSPSHSKPPLLPVSCNLTTHMQMKLVPAKIITVAHGRINNWSLPCLSWGLILL